MAKNEPTVSDVRTARAELAERIADQIAEFEKTHDVQVINVTANPRRVATAEGDSHAWRGHVNVRMEL